MVCVTSFRENGKEEDIHSSCYCKAKGSDNHKMLCVYQYAVPAVVKHATDVDVHARSCCKGPKHPLVNVMVFTGYALILPTP